jgi:hypothetical protein
MFITKLKQHEKTMKQFIEWFHGLLESGEVPFSIQINGNPRQLNVFDWPFEMHALYFVRFLREMHGFAMSVSQLNDERIQGMIEVGFIEVEKNLTSTLNG